MERDPSSDYCPLFQAYAWNLPHVPRHPNCAAAVLPFVNRFLDLQIRFAHALLALGGSVRRHCHRFRTKHANVHRGFAMSHADLPLRSAAADARELLLLALTAFLDE